MRSVNVRRWSVFLSGLLAAASVGAAAFGSDTSEVHPPAASRLIRAEASGSGSVDAAAADIVTSWDLDPLVVSVDDSGPVTLRVQTNGMPTSVVLRFATGGATTTLAPMGGGLFGATLSHADVLNGMAAATGGSRTPCSSLGWCDYQFGMLDYFQGSTKLMTGNVATMLTDSGIPPVNVIDLAPGVRITPRIFSLLMPTEDVHSLAAEKALKRLYDFFPDRFDFASVISAPPWHANRYHVVIKSQVKGIGLTERDASASYGSAGRLKGLERYPIPTFFDMAELGSVHEIGHQWLVYIGALPALQGYSPHWPVSSFAVSIMGWNSSVGGEGLNFPKGVTLQPNGDYLLEPGAASTRFSAMDLYLMGLAPASEVPAGFVFHDQAQQVCGGCIVHGPVDALTVQDVIAKFGPRLPAYPDAQHDFNVATLFVTRTKPLTDRELALFDYLAARGEGTEPLKIGPAGSALTLPFAAATGGRGALSTALGRPTLPGVIRRASLPFMARD